MPVRFSRSTSERQGGEGQPLLALSRIYMALKKLIDTIVGKFFGKQKDSSAGGKKEKARGSSSAETRVFKSEPARKRLKPEIWEPGRPKARDRKPTEPKTLPDGEPKRGGRQQRRRKPEAPPIPDIPWDPAEFTVEPQDGKKRFHDFDLPVEVMHGIFDAGFKYCSPIQGQTLNQTMAGLNVAGKAQTGTGKTAAYLIAVFCQMLAKPDKRADKPGKPTALVIAPTRELVIQIIKDAEELGKYCGIRCLAVYGGMDHAAQQDRLEKAPVDLIAATPGRLLDFMRSRVVDLKGVHTLVIDEADRMLDMGFIPDVRKIIRELPPKENRQTLLFSATLNDSVMELASQWMPDPIKVSVDSEHATVDTIRQIVYPIAASEKFTILYNILKKHEGERFLIFRNRKRDCEELRRELESHDVMAEELSGDIDQKKRIRILEDFRSGKVKVVVATDVAGRGIHVDDIAYVVNYDFPYEADDYIHRIGRTGRAGTTGTAISFACEDESFIIPDIEKLLGEELHCQQPDDLLRETVPTATREMPRKRRSASAAGGGRYQPGRQRGGRPSGGYKRARGVPRPSK